MSSGISKPPAFGEAGLDEALVSRLIDAVDARIDSADSRILLLLRIMMTADLPEDLGKRAERAVTRFRYSMVEPGQDAMIFSQERSQVTFAVAEYLAGQNFKDHIFINDGRRGSQHQKNAAKKISCWLADRFRFGFSEWLSNDRLADMLCALVLLIDHAEDEELRNQATIIADLILLDAVLNSFDGTLATTAGFALESAQIDAAESVMACVLNSALRRENVHQICADRLCGIFCTRIRYRVPEVIRSIGISDEHRQVLSSQGLDISEVFKELLRHPDFPRSDDFEVARFLWGMRALGNPETIALSMRLIRHLGAGDHPLLSPMRAFRAVPSKLLARAVTAVDPVINGRALQRAEIQNFRTPEYQLTSVQRYQVGEFGGTQHLWQARLKGGVDVFANHPATIDLPNAVGDLNESQWIGNGINPDIVQDGNVLLAVNNLHRRQGLFEGRRQEFVHFHFPFVALDQTRVGPNWVAGRKNEGYIGIVTTHQLEQISETELVQRGRLTGYFVMMGDDEEFGSISTFVQQLRQCQATLRGRTLRVQAPFGIYQLEFKGQFLVDGVPRQARYPRYGSAAVHSERNPRRISVRHGGEFLELDWARGVREFSALSES